MDSISLYFQIITSLILLTHSVSATYNCDRWTEWGPMESEYPRRRSMTEGREKRVYMYDLDGNLILNAGFPRNPLITSSTAKLAFNGPNVTVKVQVCQTAESKCQPIARNVSLRLAIFGKDVMCDIEHAPPNQNGFVCRQTEWQLLNEAKEDLLIEVAGTNRAENCKLTVKVYTDSAEKGLVKCKMEWQKKYIRDYTGIPIGAQTDHKDTITTTTVMETEDTKEDQGQTERGSRDDYDFAYKHGVDVSARVGIGLGERGGGIKQSFSNDYTTAGSRETSRRMTSMREKIGFLENIVTQTTTLTIHFGTGLRYEIMYLIVDCTTFTYKLGDTIKIQGYYSDGSPHVPDNKTISQGSNRTFCGLSNDEGDNECKDDDCDGVASLHCHVWLISIGVCFSIGLIARSLAY